jgi:hypothetical protein
MAMRKADSLRSFITACLPEFATHPDRLQLYVDAGQIHAQQSATLSFTYAYALKLLVTDFAGSADRLMVPLLAWIAHEQPQLLRGNGQPFTFEAELLDSTTSDIEISLDLTESVVVTPRADGSGHDVSHPVEKKPGATDWDHMFPDPPGTFANLFDGLGQLYP